SSTSRSSAPIRPNLSPPQAGHTHGASWTIVSAGKWSGKGAWFEGLRFLLRRGTGLGRLGRVRLRDAGARERLGDARFDIVDQQLELLDLRIELLRLAAEAGATKNGELGAQLLDHQRPWRGPRP